MKNPRQSAFTLIEMLVVISIIAILAAFAVPALTSALTKGQMTGTMNNGRQLYLAAQQMALDGSANSDATLAWPGDYTPIPTLQAYCQTLVQQDYLKAGDVQKLLSGPGATVSVSSSGTGNTQTLTFNSGTAALKVYACTNADASNVIFAVSRNYVYDTALAPSSSATPNNPYGDKGFIVQRKGGDASVLRSGNATVQAGNTAAFESQIGKRPGDVQGTVNAGDPSPVLQYP